VSVGPRRGSIPAAASAFLISCTSVRYGSWAGFCRTARKPDTRPVAPTTGPPHTPAMIAFESCTRNSSFLISGPVPSRWPRLLTIRSLPAAGSLGTLGTLVNPRAAKCSVPAVEVARSTVGMLLAPTLSTDTFALPVFGYSTVASRFPYRSWETTYGKTRTTLEVAITQPPLVSAVLAA